MKSKTQLILTSITIKILLYVSQYFVDYLFEDYDKSTELFEQEGTHSIIVELLKFTARWDSHFFIKIAFKGYEYEKKHAFLETYPKFLKLISYISQKMFNLDNFASILLAGFISNLILNALSTVLLYNITRLKFPNMSDKFCYAVIILFQFTPSSAFFNAVYSESLFTFVIFLYLFLFYRKYQTIPKNQKGTHLFTSITNYSFSLLPSIVLTFSVSVRSNGMIWVVVVGYPILEAFILNLINSAKGKFDFKVLFNTIFWGLLNIFLCLTPYIRVLISAGSVYCQPAYFEENPPWCKGILPNIYNYIQDKHWKVGFLTYYTLNRTFYIIWGLYTFILLFSYIIKYLYSLRQKPETLSIFSGFDMESQMLYTIILFFISVFFAHVQSSTRFFSSDPSLYWFLADILFNHENKSKTNTISKILTIAYLVHFNIAGFFLYSNFYTWT
ncbi:mannosyltransferase Pig-V protein (macronuclear) [Tetrahymena thermophila SB210]|uniref:GPI mannosyltransferase 2 n=1 Tax=Tetrahymena thermophila (strain SB210) TaxID=312017 RepID=X1W3P8_TETTS|nr:mannosyltransferase Pig-V protein [Tetrahymena thermophila SB210]EDK31691.2 mannosyltransferase Pig-V protein [Tetrahymena thermophila SB210]|eukprot:XP_001470819.2 mannosyltransferase Pig-V protein [Tetrahymena thermophila SB210]